MGHAAPLGLKRNNAQCAMRKTYHFDPLRITNYALDADHCIKKPLINQQRRDNIGNKTMNRRTYLLLPLIIACLSIPLAIDAQVTRLEIISGDGQTGQPGQTLNPLIVEAQDQNGDIVIGALVGFLQDSGSLSNITATTGSDGRAQTTLTLPRSPGQITVQAWVGNFNTPDASATFTATAVLPPPPTPPREPTQLVKISGDNLLAAPGDSVTLVVELQGLKGNPKPNIDINFVLFGDATTGSLSPQTGTTNAAGRTATTLTLTDKAKGTYEVEAYNSEDFGVYISFTVTVDTSPPEATGLEKISGDNQNGFTGEPLANPFVVQVRDQFDDPLAGVTVTFTVTAGGGALSAGTATTDENGQAKSTLTLGPDPGTNTVEVSVEGISQTQTFNAEATLPPPTPTTLSGISDGEQDELTDETDPPIIEVHDQYGNPLEDVPVTFTILEPDGSMRTTTGTTDENGRAEFTLPPNSDPGTYTITANVEGIAETVTFTVVVPFELDLSLSVGLNLIHIPLKVRTVDGIPAAIESVSDLYDALGGVATVNWLITHDSQTQTWYGYFGDADRGSIADRTLTEEAGILASIKTPISVRLDGDALGADGTSAITLNRGLNLVGLPLQDSRIMRVSDLFALEGIGGVITIIVVTDNGEFGKPGRIGGQGRRSRRYPDHRRAGLYPHRPAVHNNPHHRHRLGQRPVMRA